MKNTKSFMHALVGSSVVGLAAFLFAGCQSTREQCCDPMVNAQTTAAAPDPVSAASPAVTPAPAKAAPPASVAATIRIGAGVSAPFTDAEGNAWLAAEGFADGEIAERAADLEIANTKNPALYRIERYSMTSFSRPVPNGKYTVKLHFAETFEGIEGPGQRVFSFNVEGQEFKDFDVWVKAGGPFRAYIETVKVEITDGKLDISFTSQVENPEINGIEIIPGH